MKPAPAHRARRTLRWIGVAVVASILAANGLAWQHARAMTRFVEHGERTRRPEHLTALEKLTTLLWGVTVPRPVATTDLATLDPGARHHRIPGPMGEIDLVVLGDRHPVVVLVHGYAGERSQTRPTAARLLEAGFTVVAPDLRAAGTSDGDTTSLGWHEASDVAAVVGWVDEVLGDPCPVLYGFSMGGAAVLGAAGRLHVPTRGIVVESTFDRLVHTVGHRFETMGLPPRGLSDLLLFWGGVQQGFDPWRVAPVDDARAVTVPTLVVAGDRDLRVMPDESRALAAALGSHGELALIEGMGHAQVARARPAAWQATVLPFLLSLGPPAAE